VNNYENTIEWWGSGAVICLGRGADLHIAQLVPLPPTVSSFSKIQIGFTFLVLAHLGSPGQRAVKWLLFMNKLDILFTIPLNTCLHDTPTVLVQVL